MCVVDTHKADSWCYASLVSELVNIKRNIVMHNIKNSNRQV